MWPQKRKEFGDFKERFASLKCLFIRQRAPGLAFHN
jgi:hypothetical protein